MLRVTRPLLDTLRCLSPEFCRSGWIVLWLILARVLVALLFRTSVCLLCLFLFTCIVFLQPFQNRSFLVSCSIWLGHLLATSCGPRFTFQPDATLFRITLLAVFRRGLGSQHCMFWLGFVLCSMCVSFLYRTTVRYGSSNCFPFLGDVPHLGEK